MVPVPQVCPILSLPGHTMHVYMPLDDMWKIFPHFVQFPLPPPNFNVLCAGMSFWMPSGFRGCQVDILYLTCHSKTVGTFRFPPTPPPPPPPPQYPQPPCMWCCPSCCVGKKAPWIQQSLIRFVLPRVYQTVAFYINLHRSVLCMCDVCHLQMCVVCVCVCLHMCVVCPCVLCVCVCVCVCSLFASVRCLLPLPNPGVDFKVRTITLGDKKIKLQIWLVGCLVFLVCCHSDHFISKGHCWSGQISLHHHIILPRS